MTPTIVVTPRTCLPLIPNRMKGSQYDLTPGSLALLRPGGSQSQLVQLVVQGLQTDAKYLRRARLVVARVLERHQDQAALRLLDGRAGRQRHLRLEPRRRFASER